MEVIKLSQALAIMQLRDKEGLPYPFDMEYRTFNSQSKTGGTLKRYQGVRYLPDRNPERQEEVNIFNVLDAVKLKRRPDHFKNRTRNLELADGDIRKIRIDFIISINGQKVIY